MTQKPGQFEKRSARYGMALVLAAPFLLLGCSGGGGGSISLPPPAPPRTILTTQFGTGPDFGSDVAVDPSGNSTMTGTTNGDLAGTGNSGRDDGFIAKFDPSGTILWVRQFGTTSFDICTSIAVDSSGSSYVTGTTYGDLAGTGLLGINDAFIVKYDTSGNQLWIVQFGTGGGHFGRAIALDSSGDIYIAGVTDDPLAGVSAAFISKHTPSGVQLWRRLLDSPGFDDGTGVGVDASGNSYITGYTDDDLGGTGNAGFFDGYMAKYSPIGTRLWLRQFGTSASDSGGALAVDPSGNSHVTGMTSGDLAGSGLAGGSDMFVAKYDTSGAVVWIRQFGSTDYEISGGIALDASGGTVVTGYTSGDLAGTGNAGGYDAFMAAYDASGSPLWSRQFGTEKDDTATGVAVDSSGNSILSGSTAGNLTGVGKMGRADALISKHDASGTPLWTRQFGAADTDRSHAIAVDDFGRSFMTGTTSGAFAGGGSRGLEDIFIATYYGGNTVFFDQMGTPGSDRGFGIAVTSTGGIAYLTGSTDGDFGGSGNAGLDDVFIFKSNLSLVIWTRQIGTTADDVGLGIALDASENITVTGTTDGDLAGSGNAGLSDVFITKHDSSGNSLWIEQIGTAAADVGYGVALDSSGNSYVTGYTDGDLAGSGSAGLSDVFIVKHDQAGNQIWIRQFGTASADIGRGIALDSSDSCYVTGSTMGNLGGSGGAGLSDAFIANFDTDGNQLWIVQFGTAGNDGGNGITLDSSDTVHVTGVTEGNLDGSGNAGLGDAFVTEYDTSGRRLWIKQFGTAGYDQGNGIAVDSSGSTHVTGTTDGDLDGTGNVGLDDGFIILIQP